MRNKADEVNDFLDIYSRFRNEDWEDMPSEIEGFLNHHGYLEDEQENALTWLVTETAEKAVELCEQRDLVSDVYNGVGLIPGGGKITDLEPENEKKIYSELFYSSGVLEDVEHAGATTEGGWTEPYPSLGVDPEHSVGHNYKKKLEKEAEDVDWFFERRASWD